MSVADDASDASDVSLQDDHELEGASTRGSGLKKGGEPGPAAAAAATAKPKGKGKGKSKPKAKAGMKYCTVHLKYHPEAEFPTGKSVCGVMNNVMRNLKAQSDLSGEAEFFKKQTSDPRSCLALCTAYIAATGCGQVKGKKAKRNIWSYANYKEILEQESSIMYDGICKMMNMKTFQMWKAQPDQGAIDIDESAVEWERLYNVPNAITDNKGPTHKLKRRVAIIVEDRVTFRDAERNKRQIVAEDKQMKNVGQEGIDALAQRMQQSDGLGSSASMSRGEKAQRIARGAAAAECADDAMGAFGSIGRGAACVESLRKLVDEGSLDKKDEAEGEDEDGVSLADADSEKTGSGKGPKAKAEPWVNMDEKIMGELAKLKRWEGETHSKLAGWRAKLSQTRASIVDSIREAVAAEGKLLTTRLRAIKLVMSDISSENSEKPQVQERKQEQEVGEDYEQSARMTAENVKAVASQAAADKSAADGAQAAAAEAAERAVLASAGADVAAAAEIDAARIRAARILDGYTEAAAKEAAAKEAAAKEAGDDGAALDTRKPAVPAKVEDGEKVENEEEEEEEASKEDSAGNEAEKSEEPKDGGAVAATTEGGAAGGDEHRSAAAASSETKEEPQRVHDLKNPKSALAESPLMKRKSSHEDIAASQSPPSTVKAFVNMHGGAEIALKRYIASFSSDAVSSSELGSRPPCRSYRALRLLSSVVRETEAKLRATTNKGEFTNINAELKPFKAALTDFFVVSKAAQNRCETAIQDALERKAEAAKLEADMKTGEQAAVFQAKRRKTEATAAAKKTVLACSEGLDAAEITVITVAEDLAYADEVSWSLPCIFRVIPQAFLQAKALQKEIDSLAVRFVDSAEKTGPGRAHRAMCPDARMEACRLLGGLQKIGKKYDRAFVPDGTVPAFVNDVAYQKLFEPQVFAVARGKESVNQEPYHLATLRLGFLGSREVIAVNTMSFMKWMQQNDAGRKMPVMKELREFVKQCTAETMTKYIQSAGPNAFYRATVGPQDVFYSPPGWTIGDRIGKGADFYGVRYQFAMQEHLPMLEEISQVLLRCGKQNEELSKLVDFLTLV